MPKRIKFIFMATWALFALTALNQCTLSQDFLKNTGRDVGYGGYQSTRGDDLGVNCKSGKKFRQWYFLYGSYNLFGTEIVELLKSKDRVFRVRTYATLWDKVISIGLGFVTSMSTRTIEIQTCESRAANRAAALKAQEARAAQQKEELEKLKLELEEKAKMLEEREKALKEKEKPGPTNTDTPLER